MTTEVSQQIFLMISTRLCLLELYVVVFRLLLAYGWTDGRTELRRHSTDIKMCQKTNRIWSNGKEGFMLSFNATSNFFLYDLKMLLPTLNMCEDSKQIETFKKLIL